MNASAQAAFRRAAARCFEASCDCHADVMPLSPSLLNLPHAKTHLDTLRHARRRATLTLKEA